MVCNTPDKKPDGADTTFMIFASTMVFVMTPAMALAQAGMIRRKNAASMLMQIMTGLAIGSILYFMFGFSFSFGPSQGGVIGNLKYAFLNNLMPHECNTDFGANADSIPGGVWFAYQMMFAIHTPLITTGAWVEKMGFNAFLIFVILWPIFVYYPLSHAVWNKNGFLAVMGVLDYAGGIVIHASSGVAGLVVSLTLQRRKENEEGTPHHNLPLAYLGCLLVFAGWYSFIAGAGGKANGQAVNAFICTHIAACSGALAWTFITYYRERFWRVTGVISGVFAGLGTITAGAGYVEPWSAMILGTVGSTAAYFSVVLFKERWKLDDVLDCTSLQGVTGLIGAIAIGFFSKQNIPYEGGVDGLVYSSAGWKQLGLQLLGCAYACVWSGVFTYIILHIMSKAVGVDIDADVEELGLDVTQIGEQAYDEVLALELDLGKEGVLARLHEACVCGNLKNVQSMLLCKADPCLPDYLGRTCVQLAASHGHQNVLEYLFKHHSVTANTKDSFGCTPVLEGFMHKHQSVCSWLSRHVSSVEDNQIVTALYNAAKDGDLAALQLVQSTGVNLGTHDYDRRTPLMVAAEEGHFLIVKYLIEHGVNPVFTDRWGFTAEKSAQMSNHFTIANYLKTAAAASGLSEQKDDVALVARETSPLLTTEHNDSADDTAISVFPQIVGNYGSVQEEGELLASQPPEDDIKQVAVETVASFTAGSREMCKAAALGQLAEVKRLIKKGGKGVATLGDFDQRSPLLMAAHAGHVDVVEFLIGLGVPVNAKDRFGNTPLKVATNNRKQQVIQLLKNANGVVIVEDLGYEMCKLAFENDLEGLTRLVEDGHDPNHADHDRRTALHLAACEGHVKVCRFLVANKAQISFKDRFGRTPLDDARHYCHLEITAFFEQMIQKQREARY